MSAQPGLSGAPAALWHRTCCPCDSCLGAAAQSRLSAVNGRRQSVLARRLHLVKRAGAQWRQRAAQQKGLAFLVGLSAGDAQRAQKAFAELLELDLRLACEASGQEALLRCQPQRLQQMIREPGFVLARPDWLREFLFNIWIGAQGGAHTDTPSMQ